MPRQIKFIFAPIWLRKKRQKKVGAIKKSGSVKTTTKNAKEKCKLCNCNCKLEILAFIDIRVTQTNEIIKCNFSRINLLIKNMNSYTFLGILNTLIFLSVLPGYATDRLNANVVVMFSLSGDLAFISDTLTIAKYWQEQLNRKLLDSSWPLDVKLEYYDVKSNPNLTTILLENRIQNSSLPEVTAIIGPESELLGFAAAKIALKYGIPCLLAITNGNPINPVQPSFLKTSFLTQPPATYQFSALIEEFVVNNVQSLVAVTLHEPYDTYNDNTCFGAANLAASRGINVAKRISLTKENNANDVLELVKNIRDNYSPDAIIWCDWASCALTDNIDVFNPLPAFHGANYLPKALSLLDCIDQPGIKKYYDEGLYQYVTAGQFSNEKLRGSDYTEDATPYSSTFRPKTPINYTVRNSSIYVLY